MGVLGQLDTFLSQCLSTQVYKWISANVMLGVTLQWTSITSRGLEILLGASCICHRNWKRVLACGTAWPVCSFIIWLAPRVGKMNQILHCDWPPEQARWSYLACSGLPAVSRKKNFPERHIINPLLTKLVRSRWLDIGLILFLQVYGPRLCPGR